MVIEIFANTADFDIAYRLIFDKDMNVVWRAAWACQKISEKHPEWFSNNQVIELISLALSTSHGGLQRGCLSTLNNLPLPASLPVEFINACFDWMVSGKSSIAVKALSMKMLLNICRIEPDFKPEIIAILEDINYQDYSSGFNSTRNSILKALKNN